MIDIIYYDRAIKKGNINNLSRIKNKRMWLDVTDITKSESELLRKTFNLHHLTAEDLLSQNTRIKVEEFPNYLFCVFYGIENSANIGLVEFDFVIGKKFLISNHKNNVNSIEELKKNNEKLIELFNKGTDFFFHKLLDDEVDNFLPVLETIDDKIELIEEEVTKKPRHSSLAKILKLKRILVTIKKLAFPQREKMSFLAKNEYKLISKNAAPYFRDIYDHSIRVSDMIDNYREAVGNTFDAYMSSVSNNMNEVMKVLSIIATIALPLTVISGIYGTNFNVLPGANASYGFWVMVAGMVLVSAAMLVMFKKRGWF